MGTIFSKKDSKKEPKKGSKEKIQTIEARKKKTTGTMGEEESIGIENLSAKDRELIMLANKNNQTTDDGSYETLDGPLDDNTSGSGRTDIDQSVTPNNQKSPHSPAPSPAVISTPEVVKPEVEHKIKVPADTKTMVNPFNDQYDTLRMIPDVQWEKKSSETDNQQK